MSENNKEHEKLRKFLGTGILLVIVFTVGLVAGRSLDLNTCFLDVGISKNLDLSLFWRVLDITKRDFVDFKEIDNEKLVNGAITGMVNSLGDPATVFLAAEETEEFNAVSQGKFFEGIGAELGYNDGQVIVVTPLEGSPAKEAGIRPGDYILKVDEYEITTDDTVYDVVAKIRGEAGSKVVLTVMHRGEAEPVEISIVRKEITIASMSLEFVGHNKDIALLKVNRFTEVNYDEWVQVWDKKVNEILVSGSKKVILDLRGNPGGFFDAAIYAGNEFLRDGTVISIQKDAKGKMREYKSTSTGKLLDVEVVVLIDSGSASASEILSGALQHAQRAVLVGESTFGKGTAQRVYELPGGASLHLTILRWLLPSGDNIDRKNPIVPDIEVELTNDDFVQGNDPQLDKAIEILAK